MYVLEGGLQPNDQQLAAMFPRVSPPPQQIGARIRCAAPAVNPTSHCATLVDMLSPYFTAFGSSRFVTHSSTGRRCRTDSCGYASERGNPNACLSKVKPPRTGWQILTTIIPRGTNIVANPSLNPLIPYSRRHAGRRWWSFLRYLAEEDCRRPQRRFRACRLPTGWSRSDSDTLYWSSLAARGSITGYPNVSALA